MTVNDRDAARGATESDFPCCEVVGEGSDAQKAREARYADAIRKNLAIPAEIGRWANVLAEVVVAVADAEQAEARAQIERLRDEVEQAWESSTHWKARATAAESALTEAREQVSRLRELRGMAEDRVSDLAEELSRFRADVEALADDWDLYDEPCGETLRAILAAEPAAPVAAEEGGEQEAGEAESPQCPHEAVRATCPDPCGCSCGRSPCRPRLPAPSGPDEQGNRPATPDANGVHDTTGGE